ncbi:hypothetical protein G6F35_018830 [Rhizopus arrhizus]|nr:hypothetical protein G6F35_018830 [Rhizopus arrhizus]
MQRRLGHGTQEGRGNACLHGVDIQAAGRHVDHRQIGIDARHHTLARQRIRALPQHLGRAVAAAVLHRDQDLLGAHGQVHRAAHGGNGVGRIGLPIGQVA